MPRKRNSGVVVISDSEEESDLEISEIAQNVRPKNTRYNLRGTSVVDITSNGSDDVVFVEEVKIMKKEKKKMLLEDSLEISLEEDSDEEVEQTIRVVWSKDAEIHRFTLKSSEKLLTVFEFLSNRYNLPIDCVRIRNGNKIVSKFDTLQLLNLQVTQVLEAYALQEEETESCRTNREGKIEVKCLLKCLKKPLILYLHKHQSVNCLLPECASMINCFVDKLYLKFDGEIIERTETPDSLDLEGGECFEVYVKE